MLTQLLCYNSAVNFITQIAMWVVLYSPDAVLASVLLGHKLKIACMFSELQNSKMSSISYEMPF